MRVYYTAMSSNKIVVINTDSYLSVITPNYRFFLLFRCLHRLSTRNTVNKMQEINQEHATCAYENNKLVSLNYIEHMSQLSKTT